jgi:uncharacterized membrane protein (UPF0182 family)
MAESLDEALDRLFPSEHASPDQPSEDLAVAQPADALAIRAREHYLKAIEAQRSGNWALYGEEIRRLGEVLDQIGRRPEGL